MPRVHLCATALGLLFLGAGAASAQTFRVFPTHPTGTYRPVYPAVPSKVIVTPGPRIVYPPASPAFDPPALPRYATYPPGFPPTYTPGYPTPVLRHVPISARDLERTLRYRLQAHFGPCLDDVDVDVDLRRRCVEVDVEFDHFVPGARECIYQILHSMPELAGFRIKLEVDFD